MNKLEYINPLKGTEIEPGRWERAIVDCINERPFYWQGALEEAVKIGEIPKSAKKNE